jgi:hypothetical protein|nr:MAG TPA: hypothetical protein [Caudoviricetes sp.]
MAKIRLQNPYMDETIEVKESLDYIRYKLKDLNYGNIGYIQLYQIEPEERLITISPKNFAKVDFYKDEEDK